MAATYRDKARGHLSKLLDTARLTGKHPPVRKGYKGPVKWCGRCSRYHGTRQVCDLYLRTRTLKSGRIVKRWAH